MRTISLLFCLFVVVLSGCSRTFNGYRGTPQMPAEILQLSPYQDEDNSQGIQQTVATPVGVLKPVSNSETLRKPKIQPKISQAGEMFDGEDDLTLEPIATPSDYVRAIYNNAAISTSISISISPLALPVSTAMPLQPTEYRRVWIAPHLNRFGDAIHGHYCEILYREAAFKAPSRSRLPPSSPVLVKKSGGPSPPPARTSPDGARERQTVADPNLQDYLRQLGIAPHGR